MTTVENATVTPVEIGRTRGGPDVPTLRQDRWWVQPLVTAVVLIAVRRLLDLGRLREQELLRRRRRAPRPDLALLLPVPRRELRAREPPGFYRHLVVGDLPGPPDPHRPPRLPAHLLLLPPGLLPVDLVLAPELRRGRRPRQLHAARPASRSSSRTSTAGSSTSGSVLNVILTIDAVVAFRQPGTSASGHQRRHAGARASTPPCSGSTASPATPAATSAAARSRASRSTRSATGCGSSSRRSTPTT